MVSQTILKELQEIRRLLALQKEVFTLDEFCTYAGISKNQAYHLTSQRKIPFYRPSGKLMYFKKEHVMEFLLQHPVTVYNHIDKKSISKILN